MLVAIYFHRRWTGSWESIMLIAIHFHVRCTGPWTQSRIWARNLWLTIPVRQTSTVDSCVTLGATPLSPDQFCFNNVDCYLFSFQVHRSYSLLFIFKSLIAIYCMSGAPVAWRNRGFGHTHPRLPPRTGYHTIIYYDYYTDDLHHL